MDLRQLIVDQKKFNSQMAHWLTDLPSQYVFAFDHLPDCTGDCPTCLVQQAERAVAPDWVTHQAKVFKRFDWQWHHLKLASVNFLELPTGILERLTDYGVITLGQLLMLGRSGLMQIDRIREVKVNLIEQHLWPFGLHLSDHPLT